MQKTVPAISIIIPMYNVEKYVGECLDSILAQTFDDYEVIVVDDCSTDKSAEIVEGYVPKFGGKLQLIRSEKNSGGAGTPRNKGLKFSRGEYIYLMDSDDVILKNALEVLYTNAKKFDADFVHCQRFYTTSDEKIPVSEGDLTLNPKPTFKMNYVSRPTLLSESCNEKAERFLAQELWWTPWMHLISRSLLAKNNIEFSDLSIADDMVFTIFVFFSAEKIVYLPDALYIWRTVENSNCRALLSVEKVIHKRGGDIFKGVVLLDKFMEKFAFFRQQPQYRYSILDLFVHCQIDYILLSCDKTPMYQLDELIRRELDAIGNSTALTSFLFTRMTIFELQLIQSNILLENLPNMRENLKSLKTQLQQYQTLVQDQAAQIRRLQNQLANIT